MTDDILHQKALCLFVSVIIKHYECITVHYDCPYKAI